MSILKAELLVYGSEVNNNTGTNGGRMTSQQLTSGSANAIFPNISEAERVAGATHYRKRSYKNTNDASAVTDDTPLTSPKLFMTKQTSGDDWVTIILGTDDNIQSDISADGETDTETHYGVGLLNANISAAAVTCDVLVEDGTNMMTIFRAGDEVRITDKATIDGAGNEEFVTLDTANLVGDVWTLVWTGGLVNGYNTGANTTVASVVPIASQILASSDTFTKTTTSGTLTEASMYHDNIATVSDFWTLTFSSATSFSVVGAAEGAVGAGTTASDYEPSNADFGAPYFTIPSAAWGGTWANNETVTFWTRPAAIPVWFKRVVPAGSTAASGNSFKVGMYGETI